MPKATAVKNIVIHCTAGFGNIESIKKFWKDVLKWKSVGYHIIIDLDGNIHQLAPFEETTNGVEGQNSKSLHISYIGGVERGDKDKNGQIVWIGKDTRTVAQKYAIHKAILMATDWLKENGKDTTKDLTVCGHRDFSKDQDGNGIIASWERHKECPSFDAMREYETYTSCDRKGKLPTVIAITPKDDFIIYVVQPGDSLSKIAKKYKTTYQRIKDLNGLTSNVIKPKQKLKV